MRNSTSPFLQSHSSARHSRGEMAKGASRSSPSSRKKRRTKPGLGKGRRTKSKTGLPPAVRKHADILCLLSRSSPAQSASHTQQRTGRRWSGEGIGRVFSQRVIRGLVPHAQPTQETWNATRPPLRRLTADHRGLGKRRGSRRALTRHRALLMRGGFLGSLLGVVAPLIAGALGKVIGSEWREQQQQQHTYIQPRTWGRRPRLQARAWRKWFWCDHPSFLDCQQQQQEVNSRRRRLPTATIAASGCCKRKQTGKQPRRKKKTRSTPSRGPTQRRGFPPQVGNRRAGSKVTKKRRRKRTAHRPEEDDDEDGDNLHLVATASPSQVAKLRRLEKASKAVEGHQEERPHLVQTRHAGLQRQIAQCPGAAGPGTHRARGSQGSCRRQRSAGAGLGTARTATVKRMTETRMKRLSVMWWPWESTWCRPAWPWGPGLCSGSSGRLMPAEGSWLGPSTPTSWC